jgi:hypothetical protein
MVVGTMEACLSNRIALMRLAMGSTLKEWRSSSRPTSTPAFFEVKGLDQHSARIPNISCEVKVKGDHSADQRSIDYSPVHGMVAYSNNITSKVRKS